MKQIKMQSNQLGLVFSLEYLLILLTVVVGAAVMGSAIMTYGYTLIAGWFGLITEFLGEYVEALFVEFNAKCNGMELTITGDESSNVGVANTQQDCNAAHTVEVALTTASTTDVNISTSAP